MKCPKQIETKNIIDLIISINHADSLKDMNELRLAVVKTKDVTILKAWQCKYWKFKECTPDHWDMNDLPVPEE